MQPNHSGPEKIGAAPRHYGPHVKATGLFEIAADIFGGVSLATVRRIESERGPDRSTTPNREAIKRALEGGGVMFIAADAKGGDGVRLGK